MTVPAPVITVNPNSVTRTLSNPTPGTVLTDTNTPSPAATGRNFQADAVTVASATGTTNNVTYPVNLAAGTRAMRVQTTNTDGTGTSSTVNLTVTDSVATGKDLGVGMNATHANLAYRTITDQPGKTRLNPNDLPDEWKDPTIATPGLPSAVALIKARTNRTVA